MALHRLNQRSLEVIKAGKINDEGLTTKTSDAQFVVEKRCCEIFEKCAAFLLECNGDLEEAIVHEVINTCGFVSKGLRVLDTCYENMDASKPWFLYWILHSLQLLRQPLKSVVQKKSIVEFLAACQNSGGGFGGGPGQISHLAPTYAAVNALAIIGGEASLKIVNRTELASWLDRLRLPDGSFMMHEKDGEVDIRGAYCAVSVAKLTNIYTDSLFKSTAQWISECQTYEGGFAGIPGMEAHGGYGFCGLAALQMLDQTDLCNIEKLLRWTSMRQMKLEGGFQGRTNKLVDSCYSFWQGAVFPILHTLVGNKTNTPEKWLFNVGALQEYILLCCLDPAGGFCDKPGKCSDFYHTCYSLSGLSVAQNFLLGDVHNIYLLGNKSNILEKLHPLYNICTSCAESAEGYFRQLEVPEVPLRQDEDEKQPTSVKALNNA